MNNNQEDGFITQAASPPAIDIPAGASVSVSIVDTGCVIHGPVSTFMTPHYVGHDQLEAPAYTFLVQHASGRKVLFDLGVRQDWQNLAPVIVRHVQEPGWSIDCEHSVASFLQDRGVDVAGGAIESVIWSHHHFDHTGDPSTFPGSTSLTVGKGMKEALLPGYPANPKSPLLESDFAGRELVEIDFDQTALRIGRFRAHDYFGDGSFYLLDAPGHALGHMCGLARTTSTMEGATEDTFVFMGADTAHHGGEFRPTKYLPLPKNISPSPLPKHSQACPGHLFEALHPEQKANAPFYGLADGSPNHDHAQAEETCDWMKEFDPLDHVFIVIAHDNSLRDPRVGIQWWPIGDLNDWKKRDCRNKARWGFLSDFSGALEARETRL